ncbi:glycosyltransferase family 4 protein [Clavibacter michiganensis subsp. phaseoli]|uniref:glycosyltransferase family 4 protein n=1 Tax=Clavibacter phaseoli TaxID=1734031 RepID=UPI001FB2C1E4|nr:glycosyltransferase family 4 protein [Clavibacter phaseoli]MCJ1709688.1 glycosyltransferase family 4 protein [Clavibacter phaseoli]
MDTLRPLLVMDYAFSYLGGAQTAVVQQALALARAGHAVTVAAPDATSVRELHGTGVALHDVAPTFPVPLLGLPLIRADAATRRGLGALMDAAGTDLVLTHSEHGLAATALRLGRERRIPTLHTVHTFFLRGPAGGGALAPAVTAVHRAMTGLPDPRVRLAPRRLDSALRGMTLAACREADLVLSPSAHQAVALRRAGLPAVEVLSNTSCTPRGASAALPASGALRLVWAARLAPEKRLDVMLRAMELVARRAGPDAVHLDVAGGRPRAAVPPGVTVHGRVSTPTVTALLRGAHAAVITSLGFDNQPMIAMEAFAEGRPALVSDPVLAAEFGGAAVLADGADAEGLAATILRLAADRHLLDAPSREARRLAAAVAPAAHARGVEEARRRVVGARRGSAPA